MRKAMLGLVTTLGLVGAGVMPAAAQDPTTATEAIQAIATDVSDEVLPIFVAVGAIIALIIGIRFGVNTLKRHVRSA